MKVLGILGFCALFGCVHGSTLDELESQALTGGDWTAVENHERLQQSKNRRRGPDFPIGFTSVCYETGVVVSCECRKPK